MTALIKTFDKGIPYEMELVRDTEKDKYVVQFTSCDARAPGIERHEFNQYCDAWNSSWVCLRDSSTRSRR